MTTTHAPARSEHAAVFRASCIQAVHAATYDNPACMTCECAWKPPEVRALRRKYQQAVRAGR